MDDGLDLKEVSVRGAGTQDSNLALQKALQALATEDPGLLKRIGTEGIVDASPGCVRVTPSDAKAVAAQLARMGYEAVESGVPRATAEERSAARRDYANGVAGRKKTDG